MSAWEAYAPEKGLESEDRPRNDGGGRFKGDDVRNRTGGRRAAKWTMCELGVTSRVVVSMLRGHLRADGCGTELQQQRRTACGHKANGHISTKQQDDQQ
jgi:hypothetical protein